MKESFWKKVDERSTSIFRVLMRVGILGLAAFLTLVLINGVRNKTPTVQPFEVPQSWIEAGLNGETVARRIVDKVGEIKEFVSSAKADSTLLDSDSGADLEVNVMGVGLSLNAFGYYIKDLLNIPSPMISGEIIEIDSTIVLTMRMTDYPSIKHTITYSGRTRLEAIEETLEEGGRIILQQTDPYRVAVYHYRNERFDESLDIIREIIQKNEKDVQWAYLAWANFIGRSRETSGSSEEIEKSFGD